MQCASEGQNCVHDQSVTTLARFQVVEGAVTADFFELNSYSCTVGMVEAAVHTSMDVRFAELRLQDA